MNNNIMIRSRLKYSSTRKTIAVNGGARPITKMISRLAHQQTHPLHMDDKYNSEEKWEEYEEEPPE